MSYYFIVMHMKHSENFIIYSIKCQCCHVVIVVAVIVAIMFQDVNDYFIKQKKQVSKIKAFLSFICKIDATLRF